MINKTIVILLVLVTIGIGIVLYQFRFSHREADKPIDYIPKRAAIVFKINGLQAFVSLLNENCLFDGIKNNRFTISNLLQSLDSLSSENEEASEALHEQSGWLTIFPEKKSVGYLFVLPINAQISASELENILLPFLDNLGIKCYDYSLKIPQEEAGQCYYLFKNGLLFLSNHADIIHESLLCKSGNIAVLSDSAFFKVYNTSGANTAANLYLNFKSSSDILSLIFEPKYVKKIDNFISHQGWLAMDLNMSNKKIILQGFSVSNNSDFIGSKLLHTDQAVDQNNYDIIPRNIAFYVGFSFTDAYSFTIAKNDFSKQNKEYKNQLLELRKESGFDIDEKIAEIISTSAGFFLSKDKTGFEPYFFIKVKSPTEGNSFINQIVGKCFHLDDSVIYGQLKVKNIPYVIAGELIENFKFQWICQYKDYLVFTENETAIKNYYNELKNSHNIASDSIFKLVSQDLILSKSNLNVFVFPNRVIDYFAEWIKETQLQSISRKARNVNSFLGMQISANDPMLYCNTFYYNESSDSSALNIQWQLETDTTICFMQQVNLGNPNPQFLIQDKDNSIFLISSFGRIAWKKQIDGPILGKVHSIDFYKNNKLQLVFNSARKLYLIDKNGDAVEDFPIQFKTIASNGIAIADFDKDRNYRYYLAFENKSFIALSKEGRKIEGWNFGKTVSPVREPAICISDQGKDYIVFFDSTQLYLLNRKGEDRVKKKLSILTGNNTHIYIEKKNLFFKIAMIDALSRLHYFYPDGKSEERSIDNVYENSQFALGENSYAVADSSQIVFFDINHQLLSKFKLEEPVHQMLMYEKNQNGTDLYAFTYHNRKQIIVLDAWGKKIKASPIFGDYPFIFISLSNGSGLQSLCSSGNQLIYYSIPLN